MTKARVCKVVGQKGSWESHNIFRECERVWGNEPSHPQGVPLWELESWWTLEFSEDNCRGQTSMAWNVLYIIGKLLERICLKRACITHLDIWNTIYGQKKGQKSNWQFNSWPLKVGNQPDFLACRRCATYCWKDLNDGYNFALDSYLSKVCTQSYGTSKLWESQPWQFRDSHLGVPGQKAIWK